MQNINTNDAMQSMEQIATYADILGCAPIELFHEIIRSAPIQPAVKTEIRPCVKQIIENDPVTVVVFADGEKSIVRRAKGERDDREKAVMAAILKRYCKGWQDEVRAVGGKWAEL